ncbi:MAG: hypothetical protein NVS3B20_03650 [Polyangiales bacterium]
MHPPAISQETLPQRFGKYTLLRRMATGGMAEIYLSLQRSVAGFEKLIVIKRILPGMHQDRSFIDMLLHEARVAATLSHPNIVQTIDVGQVDGSYFIALEHVHGEDLRSIVRQMKRKGVTEFPLEHAIAIVLGMCAGLAYAHERRDLDGSPLNIVHRDISPQNVLCGFAGDVKIVDFGVAKGGTRTTDNTRNGQLKGKIPYMSPEQARGEDVDWRSDIFAIGVMLFELTTGKRLFKGATEFDTLKLILERDYPRPSWVVENYPPALEYIVMRALEKDRDHRYQSAREMQADLEAFVRDEKLPVSSIALAEFMKMLFDEKLAAQKEALMEGRQLADVIAAEVVQSERTGTGVSEGGRYGATTVSTGAAAIPTGVASVPPSSATHVKWVGFGLMFAAGIVGALFLFKRSLDTRARSTQSVAIAVTAATRARTSLIVRSDPPGAHIWINGEVRAEVTPATFDDLPIGAIDVKVHRDGYASKTERIELSGTDPVTRNFPLQKGIVAVTLTNAPFGAMATLDGKQITMPSFEAIPSDSHTLVVSAFGYASKTFKFSGEIGESKSIDTTLEKIPAFNPAAHALPVPTPAVKESTQALAPVPGVVGNGKIMVSAGGGWCNVMIDGRPQGATPTGSIDVSAGPHAITCAPPSGAALMQGAKVNVGEVTRVKFKVGG